MCSAIFNDIFLVAVMYELSCTIPAPIVSEKVKSVLGSFDVQDEDDGDSVE